MSTVMKVKEKPWNLKCVCKLLPAGVHAVKARHCGLRHVTAAVHPKLTLNHDAANQSLLAAKMSRRRLTRHCRRCRAEPRLLLARRTLPLQRAEAAEAACSGAPQTASPPLMILGGGFQLLALFIIQALMC